MAAVTTCNRECRQATIAPVRSMKCISRPPSRLPRVLASLGRIISVISDSESATRRGATLDPGELMFLPAPKRLVPGDCNPVYDSSCCRPTGLVNVDCGWPGSSYNGTGGGRLPGDIPIQCRQSTAVYANPSGVRLSYR